MNQEGVFLRVGALTFIRKQIVFVDSEGSQIEKNIVEVKVGVLQAELSGRDQGGQGRAYFLPPLNRQGSTSSTR